MRHQPMNRIQNLAQLIRDNLDAPRNFVIEGADTDEATVYMHGVISSFWGDIDAMTFAREIAAIESPTVHLRVNSPGGDVFEARAIMTAIHQHKSRFVAHVDGLAASAATDICVSCDMIEMTQGGFWMIHNAWTLALGNRHDMLEVASLLEKVDGAIVHDYRNRTSQEEQQIRDWMDAETWFTADEAKEARFVDTVIDTTSRPADLANSAWNCAAYQNAPKALTEMPAANDDEAAQHISHLSRRLALVEGRRHPLTAA